MAVEVKLQRSLCVWQPNNASRAAIREWRGGPTFPVLTPEVKAWCDENLQPGWHTSWREIATSFYDIDMMPIIVVLTTEDAVLFRLRWSHA